MDKRPATIFCDIDGTLVKHSKPIEAQLPNHKLILLDGTLKKLLEWDKLGYNIILTTGRKESLRGVTEQQLEEAGIIYDLLIMGIGGGKRYLINDRKPYGTEDYAVAINLERNKGVKNIEI
jgi:uncharacterized HAD superfamily protein